MAKDELKIVENPYDFAGSSGKNTEGNGEDLKTDELLTDQNATNRE